MSGITRVLAGAGLVAAAALIWLALGVGGVFNPSDASGASTADTLARASVPVLPGARALELWTGKKPPIDVMLKALDATL